MKRERLDKLDQAEINMSHGQVGPTPIVAASGSGARARPVSKNEARE
jgi:hypothetical protein